MGIKVKVNGNWVDTSITDVKGQQLFSTAIQTQSNTDGSELPLVFLKGNGFSGLTINKNSVNMELTYVSAKQKFKSYITIKYQGNSSLNYPKKNFTIKLFSDEARRKKMKVQFKDWPEYNKYVLKANWIDATQARNVVSARIWSNIVKERKDYNELPKDLIQSPNNGAVDGFMCKVFVNGVYYGRYTFNFGKDDIMYGKNCQMALCAENYKSGCFRALSTFTDQTDWSIEYPDVEKLTEKESIKVEKLKQSFNDLIQLCIDNDRNKFKSNLSKYVDIQSIIDYEIFGRVICHLDGFGKNQMFLNYNDKWYATAYDMDSTFGLYWNGATIVSSSYKFQQDYEVGAQKTSNLLYDLLDITFFEDVYNRYLELRKTVLSEESLITEFEKFIDSCPYNLIAEDYASTTGEGKFTAIPSRSITSIQQLRSYIVARCAYCDTTMKELYDNYINTYRVKINIDKLNKTVALTNNDSEATIYYTTDGTDPDNNSNLYTQPFTCDDGIIIKAVAYKDNIIVGDIASLKAVFDIEVLYKLNNPVEIRAAEHNYINTGVKLYEEDKPFQVLLDCTYVDDSTSIHLYTLPFLACMPEVDPWPGLICGLTKYSSFVYFQVVADTNYRVDITSANVNKNLKYIVTYKGNNKYDVSMYLNNTKMNYELNNSFQYSTHNMPCLLGAAGKSDDINDGIFRECNVNINKCYLLSTPTEDPEVIEKAFDNEITYN